MEDITYALWMIVRSWIVLIAVFQLKCNFSVYYMGETDQKPSSGACFCSGFALKIKPEHFKLFKVYFNVKG